jgi:hypothetical protein
LEHERTHLLIAEYLAYKATLNLPESYKSARAKGDTGEEAEAKAKSDLLRVLDTKLDEAKRALKAITKKYDDETNHGTNAVAQADWERKYMEKVDAYLKQELKWEK